LTVKVQKETNRLGNHGTRPVAMVDVDCVPTSASPPQKPLCISSSKHRAFHRNTNLQSYSQQYYTAPGDVGIV
jgi:hypothetical protein